MPILVVVGKAALLAVGPEKPPAPVPDALMAGESPRVMRRFDLATWPLGAGIAAAGAVSFQVIPECMAAVWCQSPCLWPWLDYRLTYSRSLWCSRHQTCPFWPGQNKIRLSSFLVQDRLGLNLPICSACPPGTSLDALGMTRAMEGIMRQTTRASRLWKARMVPVEEGMRCSLVKRGHRCQMRTN